MATRRGDADRKCMVIFSTSAPIIAASTTATFAPGQPEVLFSATEFRSNSNQTMYDVTPDDERFIMIRRVGGASANKLILVQNWFEELKARVPN